MLTLQAIRNHIFLAVGKVQNIPGYSLQKEVPVDDTKPPSVTNIIEMFMPKKSNNSLKYVVV